MKKVIVLGGGLVGGVIARDLADDPTLQVTVVDRDEGVLARLKQRANVATQRADLADPAAVTALASLKVTDVEPLVARAVIEAGRDCVDISFMPEDARQLDDLARQRGVTVVVDCGVAPGMSNLLLGHVDVQAQGKLQHHHRSAGGTYRGPSAGTSPPRSRGPARSRRW